MMSSKTILWWLSANVLLCCSLQAAESERLLPRLGVQEGSRWQPAPEAVVTGGYRTPDGLAIPTGLSDVVSLAASTSHKLALKANGTVAASPQLVVEGPTGEVLSSGSTASVVAWGKNGGGQTSVPAGLTSVIALAAGSSHSVALKSNGKVVTWGKVWNGKAYVKATVPTGLSKVSSITAGGNHTVALKQDGTVIALGDNTYGQIRVPAGLSRVVAIAAGDAHTVALKQDGSVVAWGQNDYGQTSVPADLSGVVAISAGWSHTVALKQDGSVVAWGYNASGQTNVPAGLSGVVAIAAGYAHTVALKHDGSVVAWGLNNLGQASVPAGLSGVMAIAAGDAHTVAIADPLPLIFPSTQLGQASSSGLTLSNAGTLPLALSSITITGPDADQFRLVAPVPTSVAVGAASALTVQFQPTRLGPMTAQLHIASNDPATPDYVLNLQGTATYEIAAAKAGTAGAVFTYSPLHADRSTGLMLQTLRFTNTTGVALQGLRVILSNVAKGITVYSSSAGEQAGTLEVIYSNAIAAGEVVTFDIVTYDPQRRTAASMNPTIKAEALEAAVPPPGPMPGTLVPLRSVQDSPQGPVLSWASVARKTYVVEYSNDVGTTWFSAVHLLSASGTAMFWTDRGQPETQTKPVNKAVRMYRVRRL